MMKRFPVFSIVIFVFLTACNTSQSNKLQYLPDHDLDLAKAYAGVCGQCHAIPHPARHTLEEWKQVLISMDKRMQERGYPLPDQLSRNQINAYLNKHARK